MAHCGECKMDFCKPSSLRAHIKRKHPDKLDELAPMNRHPSGSGNHLCSECGKCFASFGNLRLHVKHKHSDKLEELAPIEKKAHKCNQCDCEFGLLKQLIKHRNQQQSTSNFMNSSSSTPHNKNIQPQRRLFATKQCRKKKKTLEKPSAKEADVLAIQLLCRE
ncbi:unnamed protein product [Ceutorhynchus assimilis]|uniref:C2H2-type domain-containing protein n=1 Tax=Ceutorhynchus assimilis TaxID=467358 RepID=A0A9N9MDG4_9CUCU|nr:unnamed protein product [Ceutorhynchus assimilis]